MYRLRIDEIACSRCCRCEEYLPDVLRHLTGGTLLISAANLERHRIEIEAALENCFLKALALEEVKPCSTATNSPN